MYNLNSDGTGLLNGVLILGYLTALCLMCGILLVYLNKGRARIWGFYMIVAAILMAIAALLVYSATRKDLW